MSVKIVYRPVKPSDKVGYLKVRIIENRKPKFQTLGIKILGKNWLEKKQRVSKNESNNEQINKKIEETLKNLSQYDNDIQVLSTTNRTILQYYDEIINTTINQGTKLKYINIRNKFIKYLQSIGLTDLKFSQLTSQKVKEFHQYIIENGNKVDTANYNLKSFKAIINKAKKDKLVIYINDPFENITFKFSDKKLKALTAGEIQKIISTEFKDTRNFRYNKRESDITLNEIASIFLFQLFTQGLRCSDVQLLRWSSFSVVDGIIYMSYTMFKTKKGMTLQLTPIALKMLNYPLFRFIPTLEAEIEDIELRKLDLIDEIKRYEDIIKKVGGKEDLTTIIQLAATLLPNFQEQAAGKANKLSVESGLRDLIKMKYELLKQIEDNATKAYSKAINSIIFSDKGKDFVYFFLKKTDFNNFKDNNFDNLTPLQYKRLTGTRAYYNKLLKDVQNQCNINIPLTSHVARHTYTQLLLENDADITAISYSLGHKHLTTTQTYISKLPSKNTIQLNSLLSDQFNK
jgi:integrase